MKPQKDFISWSIRQLEDTTKQCMYMQCCSELSGRLKNKKTIFIIWWGMVSEIVGIKLWAKQMAVGKNFCQQCFSRGRCFGLYKNCFSGATVNFLKILKIPCPGGRSKWKQIVGATSAWAMSVSSTHNIPCFFKISPNISASGCNSKQLIILFLYCILKTLTTLMFL